VGACDDLPVRVPVSFGDDYLSGIRVAELQTPLPTRRPKEGMASHFVARPKTRRPTLG
jgi:hypothetical protein